jgi:hypothetical protein
MGSVFEATINYKGDIKTFIIINEELGKRCGVFFPPPYPENRLGQYKRTEKFFMLGYFPNIRLAILFKRKDGFASFSELYKNPFGTATEVLPFAGSSMNFRRSHFSRSHRS